MCILLDLYITQFWFYSPKATEFRTHLVGPLVLSSISQKTVMNFFLKLNMQFISRKKVAEPDFRWNDLNPESSGNIVKVPTIGGKCAFMDFV